MNGLFHQFWLSDEVLLSRPATEWPSLACHDRAGEAACNELHVSTVACATVIAWLATGGGRGQASVWNAQGQHSDNP